MADLQVAAEQFAQDLRLQNLAGLMMAFTPEGMGKAMALQGQMQASGAGGSATGTEVAVTGQEGDDHLVEITMKSDAGAAVIATRWRDIAGAWKVNDIGLKA